MSYGDYLKNLLRPMGVYALDDSYSAYELESIGKCMDDYINEINVVERESSIPKALAFGLDVYQNLFSTPGEQVPLSRIRSRLLAFNSIDELSFSLESINNLLLQLTGRPRIEETSEDNTLIVRFGDYNVYTLELAKDYVGRLVPCHLAVTYSSE